MPASIQITLTIIGNSIGPTFDLYCIDSSGIVSPTPFDQGVPLASLQTGYNVFVSSTCTAVRVQSIGSCTTYTDISIVFITTTTTTTTVAPTTSTTTSTTTAPGVGILLGYGGTSGTFACITAGEDFLLNPQTYYIASGCISLSTTPPCDTLYADPYLTNVVIDGTYSDGVNCYDIKGGVVTAVIPLITTTTTVPGGRPGGFIMYDCTGRSYEVYSNCQEVGLGCYLYEDIFNTPVVPGIYMLTYDPDYGGFKTDLSGLIISINSCY